MASKAQSLRIADSHIPDLLLDRRASELLEDFGAGRAAPGSGSAAALMGLLAAKLVQTVCAISRKKFRDRASIFEFIETQVSLIEPQLKSLFEDDAREFDEVVSLRRKRDAAQNPRDKAQYSRLANERLEIATEFTLDITEFCLENLAFGLQVFDQGWPAVRGDSGAAISVANAGAMSGIYIVNLNLKSLKDRRFAHSLKERCDALFEKLQNLQPEIFSRLTLIEREAATALQNGMQLSLDFQSLPETGF